MGENMKKTKLKQLAPATKLLAGCVLALVTMTACVGCDNNEEADSVTPTFANPIYSLVSAYGTTRYGEADPWVYLHSDGYYYYTATYGGVSSGFDRFVLRRAKTINLLDSADEAEEATIISATSGTGTGNFTGIKKFLWAPEIHYINGTWYLFFTAVPNDGAYGSWGVKNFIAKCTDTNPLTGTWTLCGRMQAVYGDTFDEDAIDSSTSLDTMDVTQFRYVGDSSQAWLMNLDGTAFKVGDQWYYAWAENLYDGSWADEGEESGDGVLTFGGVDHPDGAGTGAWSCILIGKVEDGSDFTHITHTRVLTAPQYKWEWGEAVYDENGNVNSFEDTIVRSSAVNVNEGPAFLNRNGKVFLVFSAGPCDATYCLGMLTASEDDDLCDVASWTKSTTPVFTTSVGNGVYGPGHCSFTTYKGYDVIVYHARQWPGLFSYYGRTTTYTTCTEGLYDPYRTGRAKVFTWKSDGTPNFGEAE